MRQIVCSNSGCHEVNFLKDDQTCMETGWVRRDSVMAPSLIVCRRCRGFEAEHEFSAGKDTHAVA